MPFSVSRSIRIRMWSHEESTHVVDHKYQTATALFDIQKQAKKMDKMISERMDESRERTASLELGRRWKCLALNQIRRKRTVEKTRMVTLNFRLKCLRLIND